MKKIKNVLLIIMLMAGILAALTACGNNGKKDSNISKEGIGADDSLSRDGFIEKSDDESLARVRTDVLNKRFKMFEGSEKTVDDVKDLLNRVISYNEGNPDKLIPVEINGETISNNTEIETAIIRLNEEKNYNISFKYDESGIINTVIIAENS